MFPTKALLLLLLLASCTKQLDFHAVADKVRQNKEPKPLQADKTAPVISFISPLLDSGVITDGVVRFNGSVSDNRTMSEYLLTVTDEGGTDWFWFTNEWDGTPDSPAIHPTTYQINETHNLPDGLYTIHGFAADSSGNSTNYESQFRVELSTGTN